MTDTAGPLQPIDGKLPDWVHLLPADTFTGSDGRGPYHADATVVVARFQARPKKQPLVVDFAHQTHAKETGGAAPAAGWIMELQARSDGVWGRIEWTPGGRRALLDKEYRFLSPVFAHGKVGGTVTQILGASLVNNPNLADLTPILNSAQMDADEVKPVTLERLLRQERDQGSPDLETIMAQFGLPEPETSK